MCLVTILTMFQTHRIVAQTSNILQEVYSLNGNGIDWVNEVCPLQNGEWILAGYSSSSDLESKKLGKWDGLVVRLNDKFEPIWIKQFGGAWTDAFTDAVVVNDGILHCGYKSAEESNKDAWLVKLNFEGEIIWERVYGGKGNDELFGLDMLNEHSCVVSGFTSSDSLHTTSESGKTDGIVLRVESDGSLSWIKRFSGKNDDLLVDIAVGANQRIYASGFSNSWASTEFHNGRKQDDFWCVSLNEDGQENWSNTYGSMYQEHLTSMSIKGDAILLSGGQRGVDELSHDPYSLYVSIIDTAGNLVDNYQKNPNSISFDGIILDDGVLEAGYKTVSISDKIISQIYMTKSQNGEMLNYDLPAIEGKILCITEHQGNYLLGAVVATADQTEEIRIYKVENVHVINSLDDKNMKNSKVVPLKPGVNPNFHFEELVIEPVNLYIQSKPIKNDAPYIQLELNIVENNTNYTTFLWCFQEANSSQKINYPKAYQNCSFDLKINEGEVELVVDKLDFDQAMFIDIGQTAIIDGLTITFEDCVTEWSENIEGNQFDAFSTYRILLSDKNEQKAMSFTSRGENDEKKQSLVWKKYEIVILESSEKAIQLKVISN